MKWRPRLGAPDGTNAHESVSAEGHARARGEGPFAGHARGADSDEPAPRNLRERLNRGAYVVTVSPRGPTYSDMGRIKWSSACCSMTCAAQPAHRPHANNATNEVGFKPSDCSTSAV